MADVVRLHILRLTPGERVLIERLVPGKVVYVTDLSAGLAAEHLVCADLLLQGFRAFLAPQNCPFDVAVEQGTRLIRIQVKGTRGPRNTPQRKDQYPAYLWHVRRAGKRGRRTYGPTDFDVLALVALDCRKVAYLPASRAKQTIHIRTHGDAGPRGPNGGGKRGKTFEMFPFAALLP